MYKSQFRILVYSSTQEIISMMIHIHSGEGVSLLHITRPKRFFLLAWIGFVLLIAQPLLFVEGAADNVDINRQGPYVDTVMYKITENQEDAIAGLQNGEIEIILDSIDPQYLEELEESTNIDVAKTNRNSYGFFLFNYERYPLNMTVLRRAAAFAFDKEKVANETWRGYAEPLDAPVPTMNPFSAEDDLGYHYYEAKIEYANSLLDNAGFEINERSGYREAPNGEPFDIWIDASWDSDLQFAVAETLEDAFKELHINASAAQADPYDMKCKTKYFDIRLLENRFEDFTVDWLASRLYVSGWGCLCSQYQPYQEILEARNASFRYWKEQLLEAESFEEAREAAIEIQKIIVYESPIIVAYDNKYLSAYRTDRFEEFVKGHHQGVESWWMPYKAQPMETSEVETTNTLPIASLSYVDSFNLMLGTSPVPDTIDQMFYDSLLRKDPEGNEINWFATDYSTETHADNSSVPENHTRITYNIIENVTWTDGEPLTAEDVAFSLNYYRDAPGCPFGTDLTKLSTAYAISPSTLIVELEAGSFWAARRISYKPIIPKHIFNQIGISGWNTWDPHPPDEEMVTSGPFNVSAYVRGECLNLTKNADYPFLPKTTTQNTESTRHGLQQGLLFVIGFTGLVIVVLTGYKIAVH